jgi:hypothetical protein
MTQKQYKSPGAAAATSLGWPGLGWQNPEGPADVA